MSATDAAAKLAERLEAIRTRPTAPQAPVVPKAAPEPEKVSLDGIRLFEPLPADARRVIESRCKILRFAAGALMIERFSPGDSVYFLASGVARVLHNVGEAGEITIATVGAGHALGEIAAIDGQGRTATIVAETDCVVAEMPAPRISMRSWKIMPSSGSTCCGAGPRSSASSTRRSASSPAAARTSASMPSWCGSPSPRARARTAGPSRKCRRIASSRCGRRRAARS